MKKLICIIMCLIVVLSLCACNKEGTRSENSLLGDYEKSDSVPEYDYLSSDDTAPENYDNYKTGASEFAFALLREASTSGKNTVVSPLSVSNVLSLLANGAGDLTQKELRKALASVDIEDINLALHYLNGRLGAFNTEEASFTVADSLWLNDSFDVKAEFLQSAVNYYNAEVMRLDLQSNTAKDEINKWVSDNTDGEITEIIKNIDDNALMVLANAVLMNDSWLAPYTEGDINDGVFHSAEGDTEAVFMNSFEHYITSSYADGFIKNFENLPLKFVALLPKEGQSAEELLSTFTAARWQEIMSSQQAASFCLASLPQFNIEFDANLKDSLMNMGIKRAFDMTTADFSNLSNTGTPYVSEVSHKAFIEIGPQGAKAGAATAAVMSDGAAMVGEETPEVKLDRPFVFVICDNESGIPVFAGVVNNVSK